MNWRRRLAKIKAVTGIMHGSRAFGGPFEATLWLTNRCNVRCIHCYYHSPYIKKPNLFEVRRAKLLGESPLDDKYSKTAPTMHADSEITKTIMDELLAMGTQQFLFTGIGEPFLHPDVLNFMARAKHAGSICIANTNGTLLNRTTIDELIKMGFDELRITTMAGTREMYENTHPSVSGRTFDTLKDNLLYLADRKVALDVKKPTVILINIIVADNYEGLLDFVKLAHFVRADRVFFRPFDDVADPNFARLVLTSEQAHSVVMQLAEAKVYLEDKNISHNIGYFLKVFGRHIDTTQLYRIIPCYFGWVSVRINLMDGNVYPCCKCYEPLGNIYEYKFKDIWYGESYENFREKAFKINKHQEPLYCCECNKCSNYVPNLRIYKMLHPIQSKSSRLFQSYPSFSE
jgi:MoaA/NifB/PqqE/SkfB family radical SAM enzyme